MPDEPADAIKEVNALIELRLGELKQHFDLDTSAAAPSAYDIFCSPTVERYLPKEGPRPRKISPNKVPAKSLTKRHRAAYKSTKSRKLQNKKSDFSAHLQHVVDTCRDLLADTELEAMYASTVLGARDDPSETDRDPSNNDEPEAPPEEPRIDYGLFTKGELVELLEPQTERRRAAAAAERASHDKERQEEHTAAKERQKKAEDATRKAVASQKQGLFSRMKRGAGCALKGHEGEWFFASADACSMTLLCSRCGKEQQKEQHDWGPREAVMEGACLFAKFCQRCDAESIEVDHNWKEIVDVEACLERSICTRCTRYEPARDTAVHSWSSWEATNHAGGEMRKCLVCGEAEVRQRPVPTTIDDDDDDYRPERLPDRSPPIRSQPRPAPPPKPKSLSGTWVDNMGGRYSLANKGSRLTVTGYGGMGLKNLEGRGQVKGGHVHVEFMYFDGAVQNAGVWSLEIINEDTLQGSVNSMNGAFPVTLRRV